MSTTTASEVDRFREENVVLFDQRTALQGDLDELCVVEDPDAAVRRRVRALRRRIDEVTAQILAKNMGLVQSYARRFSASASLQSREDFEAAGLLGLMRAVDSYDAEAGPFGQWAFQPIRREVLRAVRDSDHPNLTLGDFEKRPAIMRALHQLQAIDESYRPSDEEIAALAGATTSQVRRVLAPPRLDSIHQRTGDADGPTLGDRIASTDPSPEVALLDSLTLTALETHGPRVLNDRERFVIVRRFGLDGEPPQKLADIGAALGLSREAVRQIESKALVRLRHPSMLRRLQATEQSDEAPAGNSPFTAIA